MLTDIFNFTGALQPLPKRTVTKRGPQKRDAHAATKKPENVVATEKNEGSVEETVEKIRKKIIHYQRVHQKQLDYFKLVLDPTDFGRTIENILHVAFLARDGVIQIKKGETFKFEKL